MPKYLRTKNIVNPKAIKRPLLEFAKISENVKSRAKNKLTKNKSTLRVDRGSKK